jgi:hypothetical protein
VSVAEQTRFAPSAAAPVKAQRPVSAEKPASVAAAAPRPTVAAAPAEETGWQTQTSKTSKNKTLAQELREEARELQRSRNGKKRAPEQSKSWITRLFGQPSERPRQKARRA